MEITYRKATQCNMDVVTDLLYLLYEMPREEKPPIPLIGEDGIPLRDEIEFEIEV